MKRRLLLIVLGLTLPACYEFDFPLDAEPKVANDPKLMGKWKCLPIQGEEDDGVSMLAVTSETPRKTRWSWVEGARAGANQTTVFEAFASTVAGRSLLNFKERDKGTDAKWSFVRYELLTPDILRLQAVDDEPFKAATTASGLRTAIEKRVDDSTIYLDVFVCSRLKKEEAKAGR